MYITARTGTSVEPVFSVEAMVPGYNEYQNVFDAPVGKILSCEREVGNIHDTFVLAIKKRMVKDGKNLDKKILANHL